VPDQVKKRRNNDLLAIQSAVSLKNHRSLIGKKVNVLVEGPSKNALKRIAGEPGESATGQRLQLTGRTRTDHIVVFDGSEQLTGHIVEVNVEDATAFTLFGTAVIGEQTEGGDNSLVGLDGADTPWKSPCPSRRSLPLVS
jgi:tRNA-2-methylthio-N6-dimethylallyladenosine synthase